jgi:hypothetical protein
MTDRKAEKTTSRLCAADSKVGSCCAPLEGGRPRLGVVKSATFRNRNGSLKQDHLQGVYRTTDSVLVKQCRRKPGFGSRQAEWRHGVATVQNACIYPSDRQCYTKE